MQVRLRQIAMTMVLVAGCAYLRAETWVLTDRELNESAVQLLEVGSAGVTIRRERVGNQQLDWDQVVEFRRDSAKSVEFDGLILFTLDGQQFAGAPVGLEGETLVWESQLVGTIRTPMVQVASIAAREPGNTASSESGREDVILFRNGDRARGMLISIGPQGVELRQKGGEIIRAPLPNVAEVRLARLPGLVQDRPARSFLVWLEDRTRVRVASVEMDASTASFSPVWGTQCTIDRAKVTAVEQADGPITWLSELTPARQVHEPYLEGEFPARRNASVDGRPIRFQDRTWRRGIGVHSRSRLQFTLDGSYALFRTRYALADGSLALADVDVRILLDGKVVHEARGFKAGVLSDLVTVPLGKARELILEVDYGRLLDVQDRFNWIEPALVRSGGE
jgi:hypothetical protein